MLQRWLCMREGTDMAYCENNLKHSSSTTYQLERAREVAEPCPDQRSTSFHTFSFAIGTMLNGSKV